MKFKRISKQSLRGKIIGRCDKLFSKIVRIERKECEVHPGKHCTHLGVSHILSKARYPRLRYCKENILVCGWGCSHLWTHHDSDHPQAVAHKETVVRKLGENWKDKLLILDRMMPRLTTFHLQILKKAFEKELEELEN